MTATTLAEVLDSACERLATELDGVVVTSLGLDRAVAAGATLRSARSHINARNRALADLDAINERATPTNERPAFATDAPEEDLGVRRFLALTAYLGTLWCVYDLVGDFVGRVLLDKDRTKDRTLTLNLLTTFFDDAKRPGFLPAPLRGAAVEPYAAALGASYALRNACLHQGFLVQSRAFTGFFDATSDLRQIADDGAKRVGGTLPDVLWAADFRVSLRLMQGRTDTLVGILVALSTTMLIEQAKHGAVLLERGNE